jgi:hypothetical protein
MREDEIRETQRALEAAIHKQETEVSLLPGPPNSAIPSLLSPANAGVLAKRGDRTSLTLSPF